MGKIETRYIHSRKHQLPHDGTIIRCRTHGTNNFCFTHILTSKTAIGGDFQKERLLSHL